MSNPHNINITESWSFSDDIDYTIEVEPGISEKTVRQISASNKEPAWMLDFRLQALKVFEQKELPKWGPDLSKLDLDSIYYFAKPKGAGNNKKWEDVPEKIKNTFDRLGIPEAEKKALAGVGAQYDSEV
ncbi:Fe-S cluster assembly protein SufB, partial [Candidatus Gracilibacteria bacterium]